MLRKKTAIDDRHHAAITSDGEGFAQCIIIMMDLYQKYVAQAKQEISDSFVWLVFTAVLVKHKNSHKCFLI